MRCRGETKLKYVELKLLPLVDYGTSPIDGHSPYNWKAEGSANYGTRKHSSRMRTTRLPTLHVSVTTTRCQYWWGVNSERVGCPQVNKFEQVFSDYHQLSVAEVGIPGPIGGGDCSIADPMYNSICFVGARWRMTCVRWPTMCRQHRNKWLQKSLHLFVSFNTTTWCQK